MHREAAANGSAIISRDPVALRGVRSLIYTRRGITGITSFAS